MSDIGHSFENEKKKCICTQKYLAIVHRIVLLECNSRDSLLHAFQNTRDRFQNLSMLLCLPLGTLCFDIYYFEVLTFLIYVGTAFNVRLSHSSL